MIVYQLRFADDDKITYANIIDKLHNEEIYCNQKGIKVYSYDKKEIALTQDQYRQLYIDLLKVSPNSNKNYKTMPKIGYYCGKIADCDIVIINTKPEGYNK